MSTTPWFLHVLGLPPYADRAAVRRAYAQALRQIDPGADPQAFEHLRTAYEAARRWCEQVDAPHDPMSVDAGESSQADAIGSTDAHDDVATLSNDEGSRLDEADAKAEVASLMDRFVDNARQAGSREAVDLLESTVATLRQRYIDAPGELEERLILLLASQQLPHRAALFTAAIRLFHWDDIGQLAPLGDAGAWVEGVIGESSIWIRLSEPLRSHWLALIGQARSPLAPALVGYWPDIERLCELYPLWIGLHLDHSVRDDWENAFRALPETQQAIDRKKASTIASFHPAPEQEPIRRRFSTRNLIILMLIWAAVHAGQAILQHGATLSPARWFSGEDDTPATCADLYRKMSNEHVFDGLSGEDVDDMKRRATRCERRGDWHPPTGRDVP